MFDYINLFLNYIDSGKFFRQPFKWLYYIIGVLNICFPIALINSISEYWSYLDGKMKAGCVMLVIFILIVAAICCVIWFQRAGDIKRDARNDARFIALPVIANYIQTIGESLGVLVGLGGFFVGLTVILFGEDLKYILSVAEAGGFMIVLSPIVGYLVVVFFRSIAELNLALASIANNTKSIDNKLKDNNRPEIIEM